MLSPKYFPALNRRAPRILPKEPSALFSCTATHPLAPRDTMEVTTMVPAGWFETTRRFSPSTTGALFFVSLPPKSTAPRLFVTSSVTFPATSPSVVSARTSSDDSFSTTSSPKGPPPTKELSENPAATPMRNIANVGPVNHRLFSNASGSGLNVLNVSILLFFTLRNVFFYFKNTNVQSIYYPLFASTLLQTF